MIVISEYPELAHILWDLHIEAISEKDAFYYYERRWRYVFRESLTDKEAALIQRLSEQYGNGVILS
jgi:hypothetical protein